MLWNAPFLTCVGLPELPVVNYFSMMTVAEHITLSLTAVKESGFFHDIRINPDRFGC